jgi:uncharacterized Tic20 family protein
MKKITPFLIAIFLFTLLLCPVVMVHMEHAHDGFVTVALHAQSVFELSSAVFFFLILTLVTLSVLWGYQGAFILQKTSSHQTRWQVSDQPPPFTRVWLSHIFHAPPYQRG